MKSILKLITEESISELSTKISEVFHTTCHHIDESFISQEKVPSTGISYPVNEDLQVYFDRLDASVEFIEYPHTYGVLLSDLKSKLYLSFNYNKTHNLYSCTYETRSTIYKSTAPSVEEAVSKTLHQLL